ncbi:hypothetical protein [Pseudorhodoferax sp.]|uniref:hypothetical protein n=1 Tax=Pseudorhodoferax sp. TaxID=1993553 RepID=UPI002DD67011|nr:hypothetical protein [Pseudorhodoferax sp.]
MNISIPATNIAGSASSLANGQLAALADLVTQMVAIRRDTQMTQEMKKAQLDLLREQTRAIQQTAADRMDHQKKSALVDASSESATAAPDAQTARDSLAVGDTGGVVPVQSAITEPASPPTSVESARDSSLGTVVDTYA